MNYLKEINAFYNWLEIHVVPPAAINLWHALMHINNNARWVSQFTVTRTFIMAKSSLGKDAYYNARRILKELGRIDFEEQGTKATVFRMIPFESEHAIVPRLEETSPITPEPPEKITPPNEGTSSTTEQFTQKPNDEQEESTHDGNEISNMEQEISVHHVNEAIKMESSHHVIKQQYEKRQSELRKENRNPTLAVLSNPRKEVFDLFFKAFGKSPTPIQTEKINHYLDGDQVDAELVCRALQKAGERGASFPYAEAILKSWLHKGIKTVEGIRSERVEYKKAKGKQGTKSAVRKEVIPDWLHKDYNPPVMTKEEQQKFDQDKDQLLKQIKAYKEGKVRKSAGYSL